MVDLSGLNPPQRQAASHGRGPILVVAGAGSGKTRVLTYRVAHLVEDCGVRPDQILAVTFTNKAAGEMKARLAGLLGEQAHHVWISTFHSAGLKILRRYADKIGYPHDFTVYDDQDSQSVMKRLLKQLGISDKKDPPSKFLRFIDTAKNQMQRPQDFALEGRGFDLKAKVELYDKYQLELRRAQAMDFGDLLFNVILLWREHPDILRRYQQQIEYVLVDEFQDTNPVQYEFIKLLSAAHKNLFVVGDDDQSIYAFRGATIENIRGFDIDFKGASVVKLEQNYRSTGNILAAAHSVIVRSGDRRDKKLWTDQENGAPIIGIVAEDELEEADKISHEILALKHSGEKLSDIAIFYRTNAQSRAIEDAFMRERISYRIFGGLRFYDRKEIKDVIAYLRLIVNPADTEALVRIINVPTRGIGAQTVSQILSYATEHQITPWDACVKAAERSAAVRRFVQLIEESKKEAETAFPGELIDSLLKRTGYEASLKASNDVTSLSRLENLEELRASAQMGGAGYDGIRIFLDHVALATSSDNPDVDASEVVSLMTLHLAKGLEFQHVFFTGFEEGLVPHYRSIEEGNTDEERRLCYVGMTRARVKLHLSRARWRGMFSSGGANPGMRQLSRFAYDIPDELIDDRQEGFKIDSAEDFGSHTIEPMFDDNNAEVGFNRGTPGMRRWGRSDGFANHAGSFRRPALARERGYGVRPGAALIQSADAMASNHGQAIHEEKEVIPLDSIVPGLRVEHPSFGCGEVLEIEQVKSDPHQSKIAIRFEAGGVEGGIVKRLVYRFAKLRMAGL